jgi:hypothetical protein
MSRLQPTHRKNSSPTGPHRATEKSFRDSAGCSGPRSTTSSYAPLLSTVPVPLSTDVFKRVPESGRPKNHVPQFPEMPSVWSTTAAALREEGGKKEGDDWVSASPSQKAAPPPQSVQPHLAREVGGRSRRRLRLQPFTHPVLPRLRDCPGAITGRSIRSTRRRFRKVRFLAAPLLSFTGWERVWISFFFCGISGWRSPEELGSSPCSLGLSGHAPLVYQNPRHFLTTFSPL